MAKLKISTFERLQRGKLTRQQSKELGRRLQSPNPGLEIIHPNAAGIDIGSGSHFAAVPPDRDAQPIREFGAWTASLVVYRLEEIVAEKLRAILQHIEKLELRGWSRSPARDYYDLWRVLSTYTSEMELADFVQFLRQECAVRNVTFTNAADFFPERMMAYVEKTWEQWLGARSPRSQLAVVRHRPPGATPQNRQPHSVAPLTGVPTPDPARPPTIHQAALVR